MIEVGICERYAGDRGVAHALRGCNSGVASICARKSGDAPSRNQERPSSVMASCVWVRGLPWNVPALTARQFAQAQFHWGKAPPAAEPRIFTCIFGSLTPGIDAEGNFESRLDDKDARLRRDLAQRFIALARPL